MINLGKLRRIVFNRGLMVLHWRKYSVASVIFVSKKKESLRSFTNKLAEFFRTEWTANLSYHRENVLTQRPADKR